MTLTRALARPMLAAPFVATGIDTLRDPAPRVQQAERVAPGLAAKLGLPTDAALWVRVNAGVHVGAGTLLAFGKFRRLSSLLLLASLVPTTYAAHAFWERDDAREAASDRAELLKNVGLASGLLLELIEREPASLSRRAKRAAMAAVASGGARAAATGAKTVAAKKAAGALASGKVAGKAAGAMRDAGSSAVARRAVAARRAAAALPIG